MRLVELSDHKTVEISDLTARAGWVGLGWLADGYFPDNYYMVVVVIYSVTRSLIYIYIYIYIQ